MSSRKVLALTVGVILAVVAVSVFAGGTEEAEEQASDGITLQYSHWGNVDEKDSTAATLQRFMDENPGVSEVEQIHIPENYNERMNAMLASDTLPDAALFPEALVIQWGQEGRLLDLSEVLTGESEKMACVEYITPDGDLVAAGAAVEIMLLWYNKDIFDEAGLPYPPARVEDAWTWDEFVEVAKQLTLDTNGRNAMDADFDPNSIDRFAYTQGLWFMPVLTHLYSNEGAAFSADFSKVTIGNAATVNAIGRIADLMHVHHVMPSFGGSVSFGTDTGLLSGKVAMAMDGQWMLETMNRLRREEGLRFGIGVLPCMRVPATSATAGAIVAFSTTEHPDEASELVRFVMDPAQTPDYIKGGLWMPNEVRWYYEPELISEWIDNDNHPPEYRTAVLEYALTSIPRVLPYFRITDFYAFWDILNPALEQVWLGEKTAEEAVGEVLPELEAFHSERILPQNAFSATIE